MSNATTDVMDDPAHAEEVRKHVRVYLLVFAALAVLTVVTVAVGYLHLPMGPALTVALLIATVKGALVAGYFMHLVSEKRVIYGIGLLTLGLLLVLFILFISVNVDQDGGGLVP